MRLTKLKLLKLLRESILDSGYTEFKDSITGSSGLFIQEYKGFYLSLGLEISRYKESSFTASYYLSKTTRWGSIWGDIPRESYKRIGNFLTNEERSKFLTNEYLGVGVLDAWWDGFEENERLNFLSVLKLTRDRFLNQDDLGNKINASKEIKNLEQMSTSVINLLDSGENFDLGVNDLFIPKKEIDGVPMAWFYASKKVITDYNSILNSNTVKLLAIDSYRQKRIGN